MENYEPKKLLIIRILEILTEYFDCELSHIFMDTINSLSFGYYASYYIDN